MNDELTTLKRMADLVYKCQEDGAIRALEPQVRQILAVFRVLGTRITEAGDCPQMDFYYSRFARFFRDWLGGKIGPRPSMDEACAFYDLLYMMKWRSISEPIDLTPFNADVVEPFVAFVRRLPWRDEPENRVVPSGRSPAQLAYLIGWDNLSSSNACARVTWTTILGHLAQRPDTGSVVVYCAIPPKADVIEAARKASVELKVMWRNGSHEAAARVILRQAAADGIDCLMFDTPDALTTLLVVKRMAPAQLYLEMGFDAWRVPNIEFCFQCFSVRWETMVDTPDRCLRLPLVDHLDFLAPERDPAAIAALRNEINHVLPDGAAPEVVYGFFGRMTKVTQPWLDLVERILTATPRAVCFIGGGGGQNPIVDEFLRRSPVAARIVYHNRYVDGHIVGRAIDVFLDTFPFPGSLACLECQAKGVPVVWLPGGYRDVMAERLELYRDATLRAGDEDEFVRLAVMLAGRERRAEASAEAHALARKFGNGEENAAQIEQVIRHFTAPVELVPV